MNVLAVTVLVSLVLLAAAVLFLLHRAKDGDFEHGDRLSLLPLEDDGPGAGATPEPEPSPGEGQVSGSSPS
jgi:hypothetical protein